MNQNRCTICTGSGRIMGGGMMYRECDECTGSGKVIPKYQGSYGDSNQKIDVSAAKKTVSYKNAKRRLQSKDKNLSDEQAEELLDSELNKKFEEIGNS